MTTPDKQTEVTIPAGPDQPTINVAPDKQTEVTIPAGADQPTINGAPEDQDIIATSPAHGSGHQDVTKATVPQAETIISSTPPNDPNAFVGQMWGDFRIGKLLGKGGMGSVYLGRQVSLDRAVAIKVLPAHMSADEGFRARFAVEAKAVALLNSQHVIQVYTAGTHAGQHYFAMEFVEGEDLSVKLRSGWRPAHRESLDLIRQAVRGLQVAGELGIIHRDIKPANMMLTKKGMLKLMDFGLAKLAANGESDLTQAGTIMGTVSYFSPEQGRGDICDQRTDIYAIGVVFYELLAGKLPFTGQTATSIIYQQIHQEPRPPKEIDPSIPESYQGVVLKCMQKIALDRYQTASDLLADLDAIAEGRKPTFKNAAGLRVGADLVKQSPFSGEEVAEAQRPRWLPFAAVAAVVVFAVGGWLIFSATSEVASTPVAVTGPAAVVTPAVFAAQTNADAKQHEADVAAAAARAAAAASAALHEQHVKSTAESEQRDKEAKATAAAATKAAEVAAAAAAAATVAKQQAAEAAAVEAAQAAAAAEAAKADDGSRRVLAEAKRRLNALEQQKAAFEEQIAQVERRQADLGTEFTAAQKTGGWHVVMVTQERAATGRYLAWLLEQKHTSPAWLALTNARDFLAEKQVADADREMTEAATQLATLKKQMAEQELALIREPLWKTAIGLERKGDAGPVADFVSRYQVPPAAVTELRSSVADLTTRTEKMSSDAPLRVTLLAQALGDQDPLVIQVTAEQQRRGTIAANTARVATWSAPGATIPADAVAQFASLASLVDTDDSRVRAGDVRLEELSAVRLLVSGWADVGTIPGDAAGRIASLSALVGAADPLVQKATARLASAPGGGKQSDPSVVTKTAENLGNSIWGALTFSDVDPSTKPVVPVPRAAFKPLKAIVATAALTSQGQQDVVLLTVGKDEVIEAGTEFIITRGNLYVARIRAEKMATESVVCHLIPGSLNTEGLQIELNDVARNRL